MILFSRAYIAALTLPAALALAPFSAAAQGARPNDATIQQAKAEGGFYLYGSISELQLKMLVTGFEKEYGVKGEFIRLTSGPLSQRFSAENDGGHSEADVLLDSTPQVYELHPEWFSKLDVEEIPNLAHWPAKWATATAVTIQTSGVVVQYNTELVSAADVPKTWTDFIDPRFRGKIVLTDPRISDTYMGLMDVLATRFGEDFLRKLGAQNLKLTQSGAAGAQLVAAGSSALNFPAYASFAQALKEKKAPIDTRIMSGPTMVSQSSVAVNLKAPHPKTARLFIDWMLSDDATRLACKTFPLSMPNDPDGKLGCIPLENPEPLPWRTSEDRARQLLQWLAISGP